MKKIIFLSTIFMMCFLLFSCAMSIPTGEIIKQERAIAGNFSKLKISNAINVILTMGEKESVVVEANEKAMPYIEVKQTGNELSLFMAKPPKNWNSWNVTVYVNVKNLEGIDISGASKLTVSNLLKTNQLELEVSGASLMDMNIEAEMVKTDISGASKVSLKGVAKTCELEISGASKFDANHFSVTDYDFDISGASSAEVWCEGSMSVEASGASSLKYKGNPVMKKMEVTGVSSIKQSK